MAVHRVQVQVQVTLCKKTIKTIIVMRLSAREGDRMGGEMRGGERRGQERKEGEGEGKGGGGRGGDGRGRKQRRGRERGAPFNFLPPGATDLVTPLHRTVINIYQQETYQ